MLISHSDSLVLGIEKGEKEIMCVLPTQIREYSEEKVSEMKKSIRQSGVDMAVKRPTLAFTMPT